MTERSRIERDLGFEVGAQPTLWADGRDLAGLASAVVGHSSLRAVAATSNAPLLHFLPLSLPKCMRFNQRLGGSSRILGKGVSMTVNPEVPAARLSLAFARHMDDQRIERREATLHAPVMESLHEGRDDV